MTSSKAKANEVEPIVRFIAIAAGGTTVLAEVNPRAAAHHAVGARFRPLRIGGRLRWIRAVPILAPLQNITMHLMQPPVVAG